MKFTDGFDGAFLDGFVDLSADCRSSSNCSCFDSVRCINHLLLFFLVVIILVFFRAGGGGIRGSSCFCFERDGAVDSV